MSLDKFVMRGFTASTGTGLGEWVQKVPQAGTTVINTPKEPGSDGSSFVMGGSPSKKRDFNAQVGVKDTTLDREYGMRTSDIRSNGTAHRYNANPKACFGGGNSDSGKNPQYYKLVMFVFGVVFVMMFAVAQFAGPNFGRKRPRPITAEDTTSNSVSIDPNTAPAWDR